MELQNDYVFKYAGDNSIWLFDVRFTVDCKPIVSLRPSLENEVNQYGML